jgi:steroid 5-alpha reductase family enzyme
MTGYGTVMVLSAVAVAALMASAWLLSVRLRDASVADVAWGLGFVLIAWTTFAIADGATARKVLVVSLATLWGLRLAGYLGWRKLGEEEDFRYQEMRRRYGRRFPFLSLFLVFGLQGLGMWAVSLPLQAAQVPDSPQGLTALDIVGVAVWALGFFFETVGDLQLARFRAEPSNRGRVMDRGLWRYTRHPNYFGDFCVWWGLYAIALATGEAWWSVAGPVVMSCVLLKVSGMPVLEDHLSRHREGYRDYVRRTSPFFPWPRARPFGQRRSGLR